MQNGVGRMSISRRNVAFSVLARIVGMVTSFVGRSVFVSVLGSEYLGLGGFFGNIFAVISLCELGIGSAVAQSLYKPLARGDEYSVCAVMHFFQRLIPLSLLSRCLLALRQFLLFCTHLVAQSKIKPFFFPFFFLQCIPSFLIFLLPKEFLSFAICDFML